MSQTKMKARQWEQLCLARLQQERGEGRATGGRYGVQGVFTREGTWRPIKSLPDFEGVLQGGQQFIFDCKVCSVSSFQLEEKKIQRQLRHMLLRAEFNVICFFLIHWNERHLKTRTDPVITYAFPVHPDHPFWQSYAAGEMRVLNREDCQQYATEVEWNLASPRKRKPLPDIIGAVEDLGERIHVRMEMV